MHKTKTEEFIKSELSVNKMCFDKCMHLAFLSYSQILLDLSNTAPSIIKLDNIDQLNERNEY